ncbi:MAG: hypothetical protein R3C25_03365 [Hyphomonadaceae bacterium]
MKTTVFAALAAIATLGAALPAAAQNFDRGHGGYNQNVRGDRGGDFRRGRAQITIRKDGRVFTFDRGDRMFYRLTSRPFNFEPGLTYSYTDRCNRNGCIAFVFAPGARRPIDRVFAPHLQMRGWNWRQARDFDGNYGRFGRYDRDERGWNNEDDRSFREGREGTRDPRFGGVRDRGELEGGPTRRR